MKSQGKTPAQFDLNQKFKIMGVGPLLNPLYQYLENGHLLAYPTGIKPMFVTLVTYIPTWRTPKMVN
jgi:hypothetical protein